MKLEQASYSVDSVIQLRESVHKYLKQNEQEEKTISSDRILGGVLSSLKYSWLACGPRLEVLDTKSGGKVATCIFRAAHEFDTAITCVAEIPSHRGYMPLLLVGLECEITGGMVCVVHIGSSRVVRAVQVDEKVTSLEVVCGGCDSGLPGVFRALDGVVAVGTAKGQILLVDLCRQICEEGITNRGLETLRDEINPCHLIQLEFDDLKNLESHKEMSLNKGDHLCLQLNEKSTAGPHFSLFGPTGDLRLRANLSEVAISSLHFSPSLGSLLVGYNFGCWCIYNLLSGPVLDYTSPMYEDCLPVSGFAVQEPCDDPRAFLYVWVSYSGDQVEEASMVVMYALTYNSKECLEGYGCLYQDLGTCSVRFQIELAKLAQTKTARCINLRSYNRQTNLQNPEERLTICSIIWTSFDSSNNSLDTYLSVFDLNQWYKEQMPSEPNISFAHYMSCININQLLTLNGTNFEILDLYLDANSLSPFTCPLRLEEHYQPSALALKGFVLGPKQATWLSSLGAQRHLLQQLDIAGPLSLMRPQELYVRALSLGLCPQYQDVVVGPTVKQMRWHILSVALEHQLIRWLCQCAREWSTGAQSISGCTLDFLLEWALHRASVLKSNSDKICVPLFDHTGDILDHNALLQFNHAACQLKHLATLFGTIVKVCKLYFAHQDLENITYQHTSLQMLTTYLDVLQWLLNVGLLPERPLSMYPNLDSSILSAPYPVETLSKFYKSRRSDLSEPLLFIDQLISRELDGEILTEQWRSDGGDGNYPPPSLQSLLRTYLLDDVDLVHKHCLFIYVFLDLAMILDEGRYKTTVTHLIKFPAVFKVSAGVIKVTQAMWQLDHGDFSTAMAQLLDPAVGKNDLKDWQHRLILKALLVQGQHQHALLYHQVRKPPVSTVQDICIIITLFIVNNLLQESFHFQRQHRSVYNEKEILKHFFSVCDKMNQLQIILQLPLSPLEESSFMSYLQNHPSDLHEHLQIIYYLQRDRYEEAFLLNDKLNNLSNTEAKQGLLGQQDRNLRNVVVQGFKKTLPPVLQTLLDVVRKEKQDKSRWTQVERPVPMSVFVHDSKNKPKYKSTLIQASFQKAKETWTWLKDKEHETPFISTPKTPLQEKRNEPVLIYANAMHPEIYCEDADYESTPAKRMKLSPRQPISAQNRAPRLSTGQSPHNLSLLDTPIVKRKSYRTQDEDNNYSPAPSIVGTPTSILKVRSLIKRSSRSPDYENGDLRGTSTTPELLNEEMEDNSLHLDQTTANAIKSVPINISSGTLRPRSSLGVSPRRPIQRTPRPAVHFEDVDGRSSRSSDESVTEERRTKHLEVQCEVHREQTPDLLPSSKDSSKSTDDVFYSPNETLEETKEEMVVEEAEKEERKNLKRKLSDTSVKSRRSYKIVTPVKVQVEKPTINEEKSSSRRSLRSSKSLDVSTEKEDSETSPRREIFPKLGGRRSLTRKVLEQNTIRALQQPPQTRLSLAKVENEKLKQIEVSYSKTVTSIVKTSSNTSIEETCDKNVVEMKNVYTTEKDSSSNQIFKHEHSESSSKSSVKKLTEVVDEDEQKEEKSTSQELSFVSASEGSNRILCSSSDAESSFLQESNQNWEIESSFLSSPTISEPKEIEEKVIPKLVDESMEEVYKKLEEAMKKKLLDETRFTDISSIVDTDTSEDESEEEAMETEDCPPTEEILQKEETQDSVHSEEPEKRVSLEREQILEQLQSEESNPENQNIEEDSSNQSEEENVEEISQHSNEERSNSSEEFETKNILVPSSEDETDEEEKVSNQDEEQPMCEETEEEELEEEAESAEEESGRSSRSSDVIEIKSSSEESMDQLQLNKSEEDVQEEESEEEEIVERVEIQDNVIIEEVQEENIEEIELNEDENNDIGEENVLEQNIQIEQNKEREESAEIEQNIDREQSVETEQNIEKEQSKEREQTEEREDDIEIPEDLQLEIDESMREEEIEEQQEKKSSPVVGPKQIYSSASPDCLETMNFSQTQQKAEIFNQTDILCVENLAEMPDQIFQEEEKIEEYVPQQNITLGDNPVEEVSYTPSRRSKRISSKQETKKGEEETTPLSVQTRRRSISVDIEEYKSSPARNTRRRSASVDVDTKKIEEKPTRLARTRSASVDVDTKEETKPSRTRKTSTTEASEELASKPARITRTRSASVDVEAKEETKLSSRTRKTSTTESNEELSSKPSGITQTRNASVVLEPKEETKLSSRTRKASTTEANEELASKPARTTRTRSASVDEDTKKIEEKPTRHTRTRSASVDAEEIVSSSRTRRRSIEAKEEIKPASRTRTRSTSVDEEKASTSRRRRSTSTEIEEEETIKRSTRASSITSLPPIEEESQPKISSSPGRRGRKRSIQPEPIPELEEPEEQSEEMKQALETIPEKIEEYSNTHRLTRRQKLIMEKSLEQQELKKIHTPLKIPKKSDPQTPEEDLSPSSSVSSSPSRRSRTTPRSRTTRTPSRDTQDEVSSVRSVPVVRLNKTEVERHRSLSPTALEDKKGSRKSILSKPDLTKINEEGSEAPVRKRGRPKKTPESSQSPESATNPERKTASYRPLESYAPRTSVLKTRKSFKVKKTTR